MLPVLDAIDDDDIGYAFNMASGFDKLYDLLMQLGENLCAAAQESPVVIGVSWDIDRSIDRWAAEAADERLCDYDRATTQGTNEVGSRGVRHWFALQSPTSQAADRDANSVGAVDRMRRWRQEDR
jgi:hypothetical protein